MTDALWIWFETVLFVFIWRGFRVCALYYVRGNHIQTRMYQRPKQTLTTTNNQLIEWLNCLQICITNRHMWWLSRLYYLIWYYSSAANSNSVLFKVWFWKQQVLVDCGWNNDGHMIGELSTYLFYFRSLISFWREQFTTTSRSGTH